MSVPNNNSSGPRVVAAVSHDNPKASGAPDPAAGGATRFVPVAVMAAGADAFAAAATAGGAATTGPAMAPADAARFLFQCSLGATDADIAAVQSKGFSAWLDAQFALPPAQTHYDWLMAQGYGAAANRNGDAGMDATIWRALISAPNPVMQRLALFWLEFFVVSVAGLPIPWRQFVAGAYLDLLTKHAVANFRDLLKAVTLSAAMGEYLSLRGSEKADAATQRHPDENYAREVMQLFTLGLNQLNPDGTWRLINGRPVPVYAQSDVMGLAAAFTGWEFAASTATPEYARLPMVQIASRHATTAATFLGVTVPAGASGGQALEIILDTLFHHPNVGPFVCRQLIQRLVTSNPSPGYVARVAAVFANDGKGMRGNMAAVFKAALLDVEARTPKGDLPGKVREPMLRFLQWARSFKASSSGGAWSVGNTSDAATRLGQSPLRSPTVFNFFAPDYAPPGSPLAAAGMVAPELQILDESTVAGYLNFMQHAIAVGIGDVSANYSAEVALAADPGALLDRVHLLLAANQLSPGNLAQIKAAVASISSATAAGRLARVHAAILLVMASPEYLVLK